LRQADSLRGPGYTSPGSAWQAGVFAAAAARKYGMDKNKQGAINIGTALSFKHLLLTYMDKNPCEIHLAGGQAERHDFVG